MDTNIRVTKRDGSLVPLDLEKFHAVVGFACEGLHSVSASQVEFNSRIKFFDKIKTSDIQETLIRAAQDLISEDTPDYQYVAARLLSYHLRKEVYGKYEPDDLYEHYCKVRDLGFYEPEIGEQYSEKDWKKLSKYIDHDRDESIAYIGMEQYRSKYLVRNRFTKKILETPQMALMLISMTLFMREDPNERIEYVQNFYDLLSKYYISLPSPIMAGVRTTDKQFASCITIHAGDSLDSMTAASAAIVRYTARKAGIGVGGSRIRAAGDNVRNGAVVHTGAIPFIKLMEASINCVSQGGLRKASGTINLLPWHLEAEEFLVLKNSKGTPETRVRGLDYNFLFNRVMYERLLSGGNITLLSPNEHPELYDSYFTDVDKFRTLYEKAERSRCRKKVVKAKDIFETFLRERLETSRVYMMNVDHSNDHGAYIKEVCPITQSNLCQEIQQTTGPLSLENPDLETAEIGLCILACINLAKIDEAKDFEIPMKMLVRALDNLIYYQDYLHPASKKCSVGRGSIGIGITNLAYWLAKNDTNYSNPDFVKVHELAEAYGYYSMKATIDLAEERGTCPLYKDSIYSTGLMMIDTYCKNVDELAPNDLKLDWEGLRGRLKEHGLRNYPMLAGMPVETSSATLGEGSVNGFEPAQSKIITKGSKDILTKMVVPGLKKYGNKYEYRWDIKSNKGYLGICAIFQKFMDQAISVNTNYNPEHFPDNKIPANVMLEDMIYSYRYGIKTWYYSNTLDHAGEIPITESEECEGCAV